jgi:hypothetical protein
MLVGVIVLGISTVLAEPTHNSSLAAPSLTAQRVNQSNVVFTSASSWQPNAWLSVKYALEKGYVKIIPRRGYLNIPELNKDERPLRGRISGYGNRLPPEGDTPTIVTPVDPE